MISRHRSSDPNAATYSVETFQAEYDLPLSEAVDLFTRFGPSRPDLDALMLAFRNRRAFDP